MAGNHKLLTESVRDFAATLVFVLIALLDSSAGRKMAGDSPQLEDEEGRIVESAARDLDSDDGLTGTEPRFRPSR